MKCSPGIAHRASVLFYLIKQIGDGVQIKEQGIYFRTFEHESDSILPIMTPLRHLSSPADAAPAPTPEGLHSATYRYQMSRHIPSKRRKRKNLTQAEMENLERLWSSPNPSPARAALGTGLANEDPAWSADVYEDGKQKRFFCNHVCMDLRPREEFSTTQLKTAAKYRHCMRCTDLAFLPEHPGGLECGTCGKLRGHSLYSREDLYCSDVTITPSRRGSPYSDEKSACSSSVSFSTAASETASIVPDATCLVCIAENPSLVPEDMETPQHAEFLRELVKFHETILQRHRIRDPAAQPLPDAGVQHFNHKMPKKLNKLWLKFCSNGSSKSSAPQASDDCWDDEEEMWHVCTGPCKEEKKRSAFSTTQLKKAKDKIVCRECIESDAFWECGPTDSSAADGSSGSGTSASGGYSYPCKDCGRQQDKSVFSKTQLKGAKHRMRCLECTYGPDWNDPAQLDPNSDPPGYHAHSGFYDHYTDAHGRVLPEHRAAGIPRLAKLSDIRYSQKTCSSTFRCGRSVWELVGALEKAKVGGDARGEYLRGRAVEVRMCKWKGRYWTVDHR